MDEQKTSSFQSDTEARLATLESAVAKLYSMVEPDFLVRRMPTPVASQVLKERGQHDFSARFFALLDAGESLIMYSAALAFAPVIQLGGTLAEELLAKFLTPISLGKIAGELRTILDDPSTVEWPIGELRTAFRTPNKKLTPSARYLFDEFIAIRNSVRGHGAQQPEGFYESLWQKNQLIFYDCLKSCKFLELPLLYINRIDNVGMQQSYGTTFLMGATPTANTENLLISARLPLHSSCVWDGGRRLLPLDPFVVFHFCDVCSQNHVFFAEQITARKIEYYSHSGSHRVSIERVRS